jgi:hypothetical protein
VTFIQRFGDALNANVHFHSMVIDGVYAAGDDGHPRFHPLPAPEDHAVLRLTTVVNERVRALLEPRGLGAEADPQEADPLSEDDPGLAALVASSIGRGLRWAPTPAMVSSACPKIPALNPPCDGLRPRHGVT